MRFVYALVSAVALTVSASAQVQLYFPDNVPGTGTCNAFPFGGTNFTYLSKLTPSMLDPANRKIDALSFASCSTGVFMAPTMMVGIGHLSAAAVQGAPVTFPTFDLTGNLQTLGVFADYTPLWNTFTDGPMNYPYTISAWAPLPITAPPIPFVWNGVDPVGIFIMHQSASGTASFRRTTTEPYRWYTSGVFAAPTSTGLGNNGLKVRVTCSPHQVPASATSVGTGCPGTNAMVPLLSTTQLPSLGNVAFNVTVSNAPVGATMLTYGSIGLAPSPLPIGGGCNIYLELTTLDLLVTAAIFPLGPVFADPFGVGGFALPIPPDPALNGLHVGLQAAVFDPGAPIGVTLTNALDLELH